MTENIIVVLTDRQDGDPSCYPDQPEQGPDHHREDRETKQAPAEDLSPGELLQRHAECGQGVLQVVQVQGVQGPGHGRGQEQRRHRGVDHREVGGDQVRKRHLANVTQVLQQD